MNSGAFGEGFPYSNFHDMNMDWVIKIAKDFLDQYTNIQNLIAEGLLNIQSTTETGLTQLEEKATELEGLLQQWYNTHSSDIENQLRDALADMNVLLASNINIFRTTAEGIASDVLSSIPADYTELANSVEAVLSGTYTNYPTFTTGKAIVAEDGTVSNAFSGNDKWAITDYLGIPEGIDTMESNAVSPSSSHGLAFYDASKNYITGIAGYTGFSVDILPTYKYIRFTSYKENSDHSGVYIKAHQASGGLIGMQDILNGGERIYPVYLNSGGAVNTEDGHITNYSSYPNWKYTDFIRIPAGVKYLLTNAVSSGTEHGIAFYDNNKNFIANSGVENYISPAVKVKSEYRYLRLTDYSTVSKTVNIKFLAYGTSPVEHTTDFATAASSGEILQGNYVMNSNITLEEGQTVIGNKCTVTVLSGQITMKSGSKLSGIRFISDWRPVRTHGDGEQYTSFGYVPLITYNDLSTGNPNALYGQGNTAENALIYISNTNAYNTTVDGCRFENFNKLVVFARGQRHTEYNSPVVCNNFFYNCRMGVHITGEFVRTYANEYLQCIIGCTIQGGNCTNFGEIFKCCDVGYYFPAGTTAHGEISSGECAHCGLAGIYIKLIYTEVGEIISNFQFADAPIVGESVYCLLLNGCRIDTWIQYDNGAKNSIICNIVQKSYMYDKTEIFNVPSDTLVQMNRGMHNVSDSEVNWN